MESRSALRGVDRALQRRVLNTARRYSKVASSHLMRTVRVPRIAAMSGGAAPEAYYQPLGEQCFFRPFLPEDLSRIDELEVFD